MKYNPVKWKTRSADSPHDWNEIAGSVSRSFLTMDEAIKVTAALLQLSEVHQVIMDYNGSLFLYTAETARGIQTY